MWVSTGETQFEIKNTITATHNMFATTVHGAELFTNQLSQLAKLKL